MLSGMSQQIAVRLPDKALAALDAAVQRGDFDSRAAAVRAGLDLLLREQREREIAAEYRRAYAEHPQEDWIGEAGLAAGAELIRSDRVSSDGSA